MASLCVRNHRALVPLLACRRVFIRVVAANFSRAALCPGWMNFAVLGMNAAGSGAPAERCVVRGLRVQQLRAHVDVWLLRVPQVGRSLSEGRSSGRGLGVQCKVLWITLGLGANGSSFPTSQI